MIARLRGRNAGLTPAGLILDVNELMEEKTSA